MKKQKEIIVIFGKPGAGKDTVSALLKKYYKYFVVNGDQFISGEYLHCLKNGIPPTDKMRKNFVIELVARVNNIVATHQRVIVNYMFNKNETQDFFKLMFPKATWVLIDTPRHLIEKRLREKPRIGHPNQNIERLLTVGDEFELPTFSYLTIKNDSTDIELMKYLSFV